MEKNFSRLIIIITVMLSLLFCVVYFATRAYLIYGSDEYYYLAHADSLLNTRELLDITSRPPLPPQTLQNGFPIVLAILRMVGLDHLQTLLIASLFNYLFWLAAAFPFYFFLKLLGVHERKWQLLLVAGFLSSGILLYAQMAPITDGIFNAGSIFLLYLLFKTLFGQQYGIEGGFKDWLAIYLFAALLVHFSIRIFVIYSATLVTFFIIHRFRHAHRLLLLLFAIIISVASLMAILFFIDTSFIRDFSKTFFMLNKEYFFLIGPVLLNLHTKFWHFEGGIIFGSICLIVVLCVLYHGIATRKAAPVFLSMLFFFFLAVIFTLPSSKIVIQAAPRYLILSLPLLWILTAMFKWSKVLAVFSVSFSLVISLSFIETYDQTASRTQFYQYLWKKNFQVPPNTLVISRTARPMYVYLRSASYRDNLCNDEAQKYENVWIVGDKSYIDEQINIFKNCRQRDVRKKILMSADAPHTSLFHIYAFEIAQN